MTTYRSAPPKPLDLTIPPDLRALLAETGSLATAEAFLATVEPRPCSRIHATRASAAPLRRTWIGRSLGRPIASPVLERTTSKLGGVPYAEETLDWSKHRFLGQINFGEVATAPIHLRDGILAVDLFDGGPTFELGLRCRIRWYPAPAAERAHPSARDARSVVDWEARLSFETRWSLPDGEAWSSGSRLHEWHEWREHLVEGGDESWLLGHPFAGLEESHSPPDGGAWTDDCEMIWRIAGDGASGLSWGTNWVYVVARRDDLDAGRLDRAFVLMANY